MLTQTETQPVCVVTMSPVPRYVLFTLRTLFNVVSQSPAATAHVVTAWKFDWCRLHLRLTVITLPYFSKATKDMNNLNSRYGEIRIYAHLHECTVTYAHTHIWTKICACSLFHAFMHTHTHRHTQTCIITQSYPRSFFITCPFACLRNLSTHSSVFFVFRLASSPSNCFKFEASLTDLFIMKFYKKAFINAYYTYCIMML